MTDPLLAGVPVHVVAARLGHADPAVTLRVYSHVLREHTAGVGDIFAQAVNRRALAKVLARPYGLNEQEQRFRCLEWWSGAGSNGRPSAFQDYGSPCRTGHGGLPACSASCGTR